MSEHAPPGMTMARIFLLALVAVATLAFLWLVAPFSGAILWAVIAAVLFEPLNARLLTAMPRHPGGAALATLLVIVIVVVVPATLLGAALLREAAAFYARVQSGEIDLGRLFVEMQAHLPGWARTWLADVGLDDVGGLRTKLGQSFASSFQAVAVRVLSIGQGASVPIRPGAQRLIRQEDAHRKHSLAVRSDIENVFAGRSFRSVSHRRPLAHEIVLIDVSLATGVRLHATQSHRTVVSRQNHRTG